MRERRLIRLDFGDIRKCGARMAQRRIGQEKLRLNHSDERRRSSLDEIDALIDWAPLAQALSGVYAAAKGEPAWPPLALFKALLLAVWYDLSDVKLAEALDDP